MNVFEVPPPGVGLCTVIGNTPGLGSSVAAIVTAICVALCAWVASAELPQYATEFIPKPDPFMITVIVPPGAVVNDGAMLEMAGSG